MGNRPLREAAVREHDLAARLAGDGFAAVTPDAGEATNATMVAKRIVETFARPFEMAGNGLLTTTSVGV